MARDQVSISCPVNTWTELTNANVTVITFQCLAHKVYIQYVNGGATPTSETGQICNTTEGPLQKSLTELVTLSGANRVWAKAVGGTPALVYVDHA